MDMNLGGMPTPTYMQGGDGGQGYSDHYAGTYSQQNLMATAMSLSMDGGNGNEYGTPGGGDYGLGFDVNNFSFDIGDFSALLGMPGQGQGHGQGQVPGPGEQNKNNGGYGQ